MTITTASAGSGQSSLVRAWADRRHEGHHPAIVHVQRDARAILETLYAPRTDTGENRNAPSCHPPGRGRPDGGPDCGNAGLDGAAPAVHSATVVEAQVLAALAHHALGEQRDAERAVEAPFALAEPQRLVLRS